MRSAGSSERAAIFWASALSCLACAKEPDPFVIAVRAPLGEKPFAGTPAVTQVELRVRSGSGAETTLGHVPAGDGALQVPDSAKSGVGALVLAGLGADGAVLAYGRTPPIELSGLADPPSVKLALLVQRTGTLAPAIALSGAPAKPICATVGSRYLVVADATSTSASVVDLLDLTVQRETPFPAAPATLAATGGVTLALDAAGGATLLDLDAGTLTTPTAPTGATFAEVVGGAAITDDSGGVWMVGATRATTPSDLVLRLASDGTLTARRLTRARTSAAATWVAGRGLVVGYGLAPSGDAPGIEVLAAGASASAPLAYTGDGKAGGVFVALDGTRLLRIDPDGIGTQIDLSCAKDCAPAATGIRDEPRPARPDDHSTMSEGGAVVVRGGRVSLLSRDGAKLGLLVDAGSQPVCSAALPTGSVGVSIGGEPNLRTMAPPR